MPSGPPWMCTPLLQNGHRTTRPPSPNSTAGTSGVGCPWYHSKSRTNCVTTNLLHVFTHAQGGHQDRGGKPPRKMLRTPGLNSSTHTTVALDWPPARPHFYAHSLADSKRAA